MIVLILILGQILLLCALLAIIFFLIDNAVANYKKPKLLPNKERSWKEMNRFFKVGRTYQTNSRVTRNAYRNPMLAGLWHQLLMKVSFDTPTAERIISQLRWNYPGKTDRWYIEKAIYDLERDKGRY